MTTAALAAACPVLVAPAMNNRMYVHPAVQANLALLAERGVTLIGPGTGDLASHGEHGVGRMSEPAELLAAVEARLAEAARRVEPRRGSGCACSSPPGGTREPIDSVRYVGNRSSGRMGFALAERAARRGADVTVVAANVVAARRPPASTSCRSGRRPSSRLPATSASTHTDVLLMAAAVADFRPAPAAHKIKKDAGAPRAGARAHRGRAQRAGAPGAAPVRCWSGSPPSTVMARCSTGAASWSESAWTRSWSTTSREPGIGFDAADNEVTILVADGSERRLQRSRKEQIAERRPR